jgi:four helix bundle protein
MKQDNVVKTKTYAFAVRMVKLYKYLRSTEREFVLSQQIVRSGTSIGANVREALRAESSADFAHKLNIALKEAAETQYWLELLRDADFITKQAFESLNADCEEIIKLLVSIISSTRKKNSIRAKHSDLV